MQGLSSGFCKQCVLIVPLWNWNLSKTNWSQAISIVLIVPLWNWNLDAASVRFWYECSNRTFMELKWVSTSCWCWAFWCSNRTFMELKWLSTSCWCWAFWCSNRTFMELKCLKSALCSRTGEGSNRTFMELKSRCSLLPFLRRSVLIVPLWNWNYRMSSWKNAL